LCLGSRIGKEPRRTTTATTPTRVDLYGKHGSYAGAPGVRRGHRSGKRSRSLMTTISKTSALRGKTRLPKHASRSGNDAVPRALAACGGACLCVAIPFGPVGLVCVERTLAFNIWFGPGKRSGVRRDDSRKALTVGPLAHPVHSGPPHDAASLGQCTRHPGGLAPAQGGGPHLRGSV
jgi:hypothetical protein